MNCPNCGKSVKENELQASILTDCLLCCPYCEGKSKHVASIGLDPAFVFNAVDAFKDKGQSPHG